MKKNPAKKDARQSQKKIVADEAKFANLFPKYKESLDSLIEKFPIADGNEFEDLVNFKDNKSLAKHSWFEYKQGYADALVRSILKKK